MFRTGASNFRWSSLNKLTRGWVLRLLGERGNFRVHVETDPPWWMGAMSLGRRWTGDAGKGATGADDVGLRSAEDGSQDPIRAAWFDADGSGADGAGYRSQAQKTDEGRLSNFPECLLRIKVLQIL